MRQIGMFMVLVMACGDDARVVSEVNAGTDASASDATVATDSESQVDSGAPTDASVSADTSTTTDAHVTVDVLEPITEQACGDHLDNDGDGLIDCDDVDDCGADEACSSGPGALHAACASARDCAGPRQLCHDEASSGYPGGECSRWCDPSVPIGEDCGADSFCFGEAPSRGTCVRTCSLVDGAPCRDGYACEAYQIFDGVSIIDTSRCAPACDDDAQCGVRGACFDVNGWAMSGLCVAPEDCTTRGDEDEDGLLDCEDDDCASAPTCDPAPSCASATTLTVTAGTDTHVTGDTTDGTQLFSGSCTGNHGGHEQLYRVTAGDGGTGVLEVELGGGPDLGVYVRTDCAAAETETGCADLAYEGETEYTRIPVPGGVPFALYVDAIGEDDRGAFDMTLRFVPDDCGDGIRTGLEQCDDHNESAGDGCSPTCQIVRDDLCAAAIPLTIPSAVTGDTLQSASYWMQGSCTLPGNEAKEDVYTFTAADEGRVKLTLTGTSGTTDLLLYVRTACDGGSEVACADDTRAAGVEAVTFGVTAGTTYYVFVDGMLSDFDGGRYTLTASTP